MDRVRNTDDFIRKAKIIHGDKYDYSKTNYVNATTKVIITCKVHGDFLQTPHNHLSNKSGCPKCCKNHNRYDTKTFIEAAKNIHGNKYDYSKVEYVNNFTKVRIVCPEHGEFWKSPNHHLRGQGCPLCSKESAIGKSRITTDDFIRKAREIHIDKYDYSLVDYKNANTKVKIICPKHGIFEQEPHHHLNSHGCPYCSSSVMETEVAAFLKENNIEFIRQYRSKWLGRQSLDFYLPKYKIGIECQGEQHYQKVYYRKTGWTDKLAEKNFEKIKCLDEEKLRKCCKNGIKLIYYCNKEIDYWTTIYCDKNELLKVIMNNEMGRVLPSSGNR